MKIDVDEEIIEYIYKNKRVSAGKRETHAQTLKRLLNIQENKLTTNEGN